MWKQRPFPSQASSFPRQHAHFIICRDQWLNLHKNQWFSLIKAMLWNSFFNIWRKRLIKILGLISLWLLFLPSHLTSSSSNFAQHLRYIPKPSRRARCDRKEAVHLPPLAVSASSPITAPVNTLTGWAAGGGVETVMAASVRPGTGCTTSHFWPVQLLELAVQCPLHWAKVSTRQQFPVQPWVFI